MDPCDPKEWRLSERSLANVVGLDAEADWLLGSEEGGGEARATFLSKTLTKQFEYRNYPERAVTVDGAANKVEKTTVEAAAKKSANEPPLSFLISPAPGEKNGKEILNALLEIAKISGALLLMDQREQEVLSQGGIAGAIINATFFEAAVHNHHFAKMKKVMRLSSALRERAVPYDGVPQPVRSAWVPPRWLKDAFQNALKTSPKKKGPPVVVGVIDDSFAIGHPRFQFSKEESRVFSYWDQDADVRPSESTVPFGRELLSFNPIDVGPPGAPDLPGLNAFLAQAVAENRPVAEFYSLPELRFFFPPRPTEALRLASHGTHVLDLAAGAPHQSAKGMPHEQPAAEAPALVLVKLPRTSVQQTSGAHLEYFLLQGVRHIIDRARMMHPDAKVVIVSSYGFYGGPHDGASQIERALDAIISDAENDVEIVLPSGNGRLERSHTRRDFVSQTTQEIEWRLPPDDHTPSVMEIWSEPYPQNAGAMTELSVVTPEGKDSAAVGVVLNDEDTSKQLVLIENGQVVVQVVCVHPALHPGRRQFLVWMQPTALAGPGLVSAPAASGVWTVRLRKLDAVYTRPASVWIRRDDSLVGFSSRGRQSGIERDWTVWKNNPNLSQASRENIGDAGTAQRSNTISKIATGSRTVIVGGFDAGGADHFPVLRSAGGPTAPRPDPSWPERVGPDALAPSDIISGIGIAAAGFFGNGKVRFKGTSVAAPLVASELAKAIQQAGYPGGREYVQSRAAASEATLPAKSAPSVELGGGGRYVTPQMTNRALPFEGT
ncbi:MAG: S8 family serine peptidase [Roseobacter sp.]